MSKSKQSNRNSNLADDKDLEERGGSRVNSVHGGKMVEAIAPEELIQVNDDKCTHELMVRDESETDFNAFKCANDKCGIVALYPK